MGRALRSTMLASTLLTGATVAQGQDCNDCPPPVQPVARDVYFANNNAALDQRVCESLAVAAARQSGTKWGTQKICGPMTVPIADSLNPTTPVQACGVEFGVVGLSEEEKDCPPRRIVASLPITECVPATFVRDPDLTDFVYSASDGDFLRLHLKRDSTIALNNYSGPVSGTEVFSIIGGPVKPLSFQNVSANQFNLNVSEYKSVPGSLRMLREGARFIENYVRTSANPHTGLEYSWIGITNEHGPIFALREKKVHADGTEKLRLKAELAFRNKTATLTVIDDGSYDRNQAPGDVAIIFIAKNADGGYYDKKFKVGTENYMSAQDPTQRKILTFDKQTILLADFNQTVTRYTTVEKIVQVPGPATPATPTDVTAFLGSIGVSCVSAIDQLCTQTADSIAGFDRKISYGTNDVFLRYKVEQGTGLARVDVQLPSKDFGAAANYCIEISDKETCNVGGSDYFTVALAQPTQSTPPAPQPPTPTAPQPPTPPAPTLPPTQSAAVSYLHGLGYTCTLYDSAEKLDPTKKCTAQITPVQPFGLSRTYVISNPAGTINVYFEEPKDASYGVLKIVDANTPKFSGKAQFCLTGQGLNDVCVDKRSAYREVKVPTTLYKK